MKQTGGRELEVIFEELRSVLALTGDVVELGCYKGDTSVELGRILCGVGKKLWVYDSFEGLPEKSREDESGAGGQFKLGELRASKREVVDKLRKIAGLEFRVVKGWFGSLADEDLPSGICFAFLDGDYYGSVKDSLKLVEKKMVGGGVIVVDDYINEVLPGVQRAVDEWRIGKNVRMRTEASLAVIKVLDVVK